MSNGTNTYSLKCQKFCIDFDVNMPLSLDWTRGFNVKKSDFAFAAGDIWLRIEEKRYPLVSEFHSGNIIEVLAGFSKCFSEPASVYNLEKIISLGGWGRWMQGYWSRLNNDCSAVDDEETFDLLIPLSLIEGRDGHLACYKYNGMAIIEVATRPTKNEKPIFVWSKLDQETFACETLKIHKSIKEEILQRGKLGIA